MGRGGTPLEEPFASRRPEPEEVTRSESPEGVVVYRRGDGRPHNDSGPAAVIPAGVTFAGLRPFHGPVAGPATLYMTAGELDRQDGPAIEWGSGILEYYRAGYRHASDQPALVIPAGASWRSMGEVTIEGPAELWYSEGLLHREGGPSVELADGTEIWYLEGSRHRDAGPAYVSPSETSWWQSNRLQREDGPALIRPNGDEEWYDDGLLHREGGPALIHLSGRREWWTHGKRDGGGIAVF